MCPEESCPYVPVFRLLGLDDHGHSHGRVNTDDNDDIMEIIFLGGCLMWKLSNVYSGACEYNNDVSSSFMRCKYLDRELAIVLLVPGIFFLNRGYVACPYQSHSHFFVKRDLFWVRICLLQPSE